MLELLVDGRMLRCVALVNLYDVLDVCRCIRNCMNDPNVGDYVRPYGDGNHLHFESTHRALSLSLTSYYRSQTYLTSSTLS